MKYTLNGCEVLKARMIKDGNHHAEVLFDIGVSLGDHGGAISVDIPIEAADGETIESFRERAIVEAKAALAAIISQLP